MNMHRRTQCKWGSQTNYAWLWESHTVSAVRWEAGIECVDTDMVYCQTQAHTYSLTGQSLLKAWIKLWSWCRVNMKAFTAVKKSRLWLEFDVQECFLMPAFADDSPFKSSRAFAGSLPSKICWINGFTSTCSLWVFLFFPVFFFLNFLKGRCQVCSPCLATFSVDLNHKAAAAASEVSSVIKRWI